MAIMWNGSLIPNIDPNGAPYSGMLAYFFDAGTTTPRTVYRDSDLGESHDHPVVANASGQFPPVFLPAGDYRLRLSSQAGVTIWDVDGISTPSTGEGGGGGGGDTPVELLARTGDYKFRHDTGSHSGWVRAAGRTIGNASSGAAERANSDCEALFLHLWEKDTTLTVPGGRGANAASDWAASKSITLPDLRLRGLIGMASMGSSTTSIITGSYFDGGENGNILGATVGVGGVTLVIAQMPAHAHGGTTSYDGDHSHGYNDDTLSGGGMVAGGGSFLSAVTNAKTTTTNGAHSHGVNITETGGSAEHLNVQPSAVATCYLKL